MKNFQSQGFWSGGRRAYLKALRDEEKEKILPLRKKLKEESDPNIKRGLKDQINSIRTEFKKKRKAADSGLFMNE